jgi:hypothetical protein
LALAFATASSIELLGDVKGQTLIVPQIRIQLEVLVSVLRRIPSTQLHLGQDIAMGLGSDCDCHFWIQHY